MIITRTRDGVIINSHFASKADEEIAMKMSKIIAKLINRDLENMRSVKNAESSEEPSTSNI